MVENEVAADAIRNVAKFKRRSVRAQ
jgi:hypothetical protein